MTIEAPDRRAVARTAGEAHGIVSSRVRPGHVVQVIDVASGGVLVEGGKGLRPGAAIDLQLETARRRTTLRGRVLRCVVSRLQPNAVWYRTAIALDGGMPRLLDEDGGGECHSRPSLLATQATGSGDSERVVNTAFRGQTR
jgi:hypothetical protein